MKNIELLEQGDIESLILATADYFGSYHGYFEKHKFPTYASGFKLTDLINFAELIKKEPNERTGELKDFMLSEKTNCIKRIEERRKEIKDIEDEVIRWQNKIDRIRTIDNFEEAIRQLIKYEL